LGLVVVGLNLLFPPSAAVAQSGDVRPHGHYPRPVYFAFFNRMNATAPADAATFDVVLTDERADTTVLEAVQALNPSIRMICFIGAAVVNDTIKNGWDPADTLRLDLLRKVHVIQNDWLLKDVAGNPITTWEGQFSDTWAINLTPHCPADAFGDRYSSWAPRAIARRFSPDGVGTTTYRGWTGFLMDQMPNGISYAEGIYGNGQIDMNGDGIPDDDHEINEAWRQEVETYFSQLRARVRPELSISVNGDTVVLQDIDGQMFEGCLHDRPWWEDMYGRVYHHGGYLRDLALSRPGPMQLCIFHARYVEEDYPDDFERFSRLTAGSSCLGDGYYILEDWNGGDAYTVLSSPMYEIDLGLPVEDMRRELVDTDTLYTRAFTKGIVQVNPNNVDLQNVPARDAVFTFYAKPDSPRVEPSDTSAVYSWVVPETEGNRDYLNAFEIRYATFPIDTSNWEDAERIFVWDNSHSWLVGDRLSVTLHGLTPETPYYVACRTAYRGTHLSEPGLVLSFETTRDRSSWFDPGGAAPPDREGEWAGDAEVAGANGRVNVLTSFRDDLVAGGSFTQIGGVGANRVVRWDGQRWRPLGSGVGGEVLAVTVFNNDLIVGGSFGTAGGLTALNVARWDGSAWHAMGEGIGDTVRALTVYDGQLVAASAASSEDDAAAEAAYSQIISWDGTEWGTLGAPADDIQRFPELFALVEYRGNLIAQGHGVDDSGNRATPLLSWNGAQWTTIADNFHGPVYALGAAKGDLIVGGAFGAVGGMSANGIARWDGNEWQAIGAGFDGGVHAVAEYNGYLVAAGDFTRSGPDALSGIAWWDSAYWRSFESGIDGVGKVLAVHGDALYVGGELYGAGDLTASGIARWRDSDDWTPTDPDDPGDPDGVVPAGLLLAPARPNPFRGAAALGFTLPSRQHVRLAIHDVQGRLARVLIDEVRDAGVWYAFWDGRAGDGTRLGPGVYFAHLESPEGVRVRKLVLAR
jgi:hypothetical protein